MSSKSNGQVPLVEREGGQIDGAGPEHHFDRRKVGSTWRLGLRMQRSEDKPSRNGGSHSRSCVETGDLDFIALEPPMYVLKANNSDPRDHVDNTE